jgi:uracil phosphoribosyltransferase
VSENEKAAAVVATVTLVDHPVLVHRVAALRNKRTDRDSFRQLVGEITRFLAYEALRDLGMVDVVIDTPVTDGAVGFRVNENILVVPVLRAGLGMVQPIQEVVPLTEVAHVGLRRDEVTLESEVYLNRLPRDLAGRRVIVCDPMLCDPMLATGGSLVQVCDMVQARGAKQVIVLCIIASVPGLVTFRAAHPSVPMFCAAVDPELNEVGYIVPGLGDAGDRLFGPPD